MLLLRGTIVVLWTMSEVMLHLGEVTCGNHWWGNSEYRGDEQYGPFIRQEPWLQGHIYNYTSERTPDKIPSDDAGDHQGCWFNIFQV